VPKFCVPVIYSGLNNYIVTARSKLDARCKAEEAFNNGLDPDRCGNEYEGIETVGDAEKLQPVLKAKAKRDKPNTICTDCKFVGTKADFAGLTEALRCPNCDSREIIPLKMVGLCKICFEPQEQCFGHCHDRQAKGGKHVPDLRFIKSGDTDGIIDVPCRLCGVTGSMRIEPKDISFE
jgi:hypothetical protein